MRPVQETAVSIGETALQQILENGDMHDIGYAQEKAAAWFQVMIDVGKGSLGAQEMLDDISADDAVKGSLPVRTGKFLDIAGRHIGKV